MKWPTGKVPDHIVHQYGTARAWKALKRKEVKAMQKALADLRLGCAYLPCGQKPVEAIAKALDEIGSTISAKAWGR